VFWTRRNDIDLLFGIYQYGYANYTSMKSNKKISFYQLDQPEKNFTDFPLADHITRRLKKLVQLIEKVINDKTLHFKIPPLGKEEKEASGLSADEKEQVCCILENFGMPSLNDGKLDYNFLKSKLQTDPDQVLKEKEEEAKL